MPKFDGRRIKLRREAMKPRMTQEDLALAVGTSQKNISDYERNIQTNISADMLSKLAKTLNAPVGFFFEDENEKNEEVDGLELLALEEFRALSDEAKEFALKFLRDLQQFTSRQSK